MRRFLIAWLVLALGGCNRAPPPRPVAPPSKPVEPPPAPTIGPWGETLALTPDFCLPQERRAPKVPAGDKLWKNLAAPITVERLENALLLCHAKVTDQVQWDGFFGPDLLFEFRIGQATPVRLWGPEDHWKMYVSVPRVTLARGDAIGLHAWDRDVSSNTEIGFAVIMFYGTFPIHLKHTKDDIDYLDVECRAMTEAQCIEGARPRLASLDQALDRIRIYANPKAIHWGLDTPGGVWWVKRNYFGENFRYPAGFLGWEHPLIQQRLQRLAKIEADWARAKQEALSTLLAELPPSNSWTELGDGAAARVTRMTCDPANACTVELETRGLPAGLGEISAGVVDATAEFRSLGTLTPGKTPGQLVAAPLPAPRPRLVYLFRKEPIYLKVE